MIKGRFRVAAPLDVKWFFKALRWLTGMELRGISLIRIRFTFAEKIKHMHKDKKQASDIENSLRSNSSMSKTKCPYPYAFIFLPLGKMMRLKHTPLQFPCPQSALSPVKTKGSLRIGELWRNSGYGERMGWGNQWGRFYLTID